MFGLKSEFPALLLMRDEVVLYCSPIGEMSDEGLGALPAQAARLDMHRVREELEEERRNRVAIFERRVCSTARRLR